MNDETIAHARAALLSLPWRSDNPGRWYLPREETPHWALELLRRPEREASFFGQPRSPWRQLELEDGSLVRVGGSLSLVRISKARRVHKSSLEVDSAAKS